MADDDARDQDDHDDDTGGEDLVPRSHIRQLEERARKAKELEDRLAAMERESAFAKALGSAAEDPAAKYFTKAYDGEFTVEAIREAAKEARLFQEPRATSQPDADLDAHARIAAASEGAGESRPLDLHEAISKASSESEILDLLEAAAARGETVPPTTRSLQ